MTDSTFRMLLIQDLGFDISAKMLRDSKPKFKKYNGKMSDFNKEVFFNNELYKNFINTFKSNTQS